MKVSSKGRYGLKAIVDIAQSNSPVTLKSIAAHHGISENYLEQVIAPLKKSHIVIGLRGANGGYSLARAPDMITVGDVLRALEGSLAPTDCIEGGATCGDADCSICASKDVFRRIFTASNEIVDSITITDLVKKETQNDLF